MKKIIAGIFVSALFIYLSLKGTDFQGVVAGLKKVGFIYMPPFLFVMFLMQLLRAWRWELILRPLGKVRPLTVFAVTNVGFLAITALPARIGELVRPYLIARTTPIRMSAALGTIFVERILDGTTILAIAFVTPFFTSLPPWLIKTNSILFVIAIALLFVTMLAAFRPAAAVNLLSPFIGILPTRWSGILTQTLHHFLDGFGIIGKWNRFFYILLLSFVIWLADALAIYILFIAFHFSLQPAAAFVLMIILIIGIAIPAAPGFIGNWHFACVLALSYFGIPKTEALTFAIVYHFLAVGLIVILGLCFMPLLKFSFTDLWAVSSKRPT